MVTGGIVRRDGAIGRRRRPYQTTALASEDVEGLTTDVIGRGEEERARRGFMPALFTHLAFQQREREMQQWHAQPEGQQIEPERRADPEPGSLTQVSDHR